MGMTAENVATRGQILPLTVKRGRTEAVFDTDEHVRPDITPDELSKLCPAFRKHGTVTAGNASGINDGAAALMLMAADVAAARGVTPLARIVSCGLGGVAPDLMGLGPVPATRAAMARAGQAMSDLDVSDLDVIESNEAFAAQACAVSADPGLPAGG